MKNYLSFAIVLFSLLAFPQFAYSSSDQTVLITGANRGIGLEYAKQFLAKGYKVIGTARKPATATELKKSGAEVLQLDVTDEKSVADLKAALKGRAIDILINNAGYFDRQDVTLDKVDFNTFARTLDINTLGPLRVTQALIGNLEKGQRKTVISMSSGLGSIEKSTGRWYAYRTSKTGLNQINKILSTEYKDQGFIFTVVHPGWVQTDMGGSNATYTPTQSVQGLIKVIEGLTTKDSGQFYDLNGKSIPW
ncbi:SDR family oxidoreductase [Aliikangiella marina]|uniref:SDR family oxidoreductase n=1 Tax=Aliikangiella marina TaxID=1712262 RepID=A0A545TH43_9GAMM|nr:SDR family oxidoreductase [Aliikangiella marina]TQV76550.1 SDR family oxidoreductase [Aliikangiella marina]